MGWVVVGVRVGSNCAAASSSVIFFLLGGPGKGVGREGVGGGICVGCMGVGRLGMGGMGGGMGCGGG